MCAFLYECLTYTFLYKCLTYTFPSPACAGLFCVRILDRPANKNALRETKACPGRALGEVCYHMSCALEPLQKQWHSS